MKSQKMLSESDIDLLEKRLKDTFTTKEEFMNLKDDIFTKLDRILNEIVSTRKEITILSPRSSNHDDRLEDLEKIHPKGRHTS